METPCEYSTQQGETGTGYASSLDKIEQFLKSKDDTTRFVGLALLKTTLDNSQSLRADEDTLTSLWQCISPEFLDRLLRWGPRTGPAREHASEMRDLAVSILYTFTVLLPEQARTDDRLVGRAPLLVEAALRSSRETTELILRTLLTLASTPGGGRVLARMDDWTPLTEMVPDQPRVLQIILWSWLHASNDRVDRAALADKIDSTIGVLTRSFKGTDGITLLEFVAEVLGRLDDEVIPHEPSWLGALVVFIRNPTTNKPTSAGRAAYANCSAKLLMTYPAASQLLFGDDGSASPKPFTYLFVNLILVDLRASLPSLLEKLNTPDYAAMSTRLTSDLVVLSSFIDYLVRQMDVEDDSDMSVSSTFNMAPELILNLKRTITDTFSLLTEYLRDRWDAAVSGVAGLHEDARYGESHTFSGSHRTIAWDSRDDPAPEDPLLLAALRALGLWLREDDGEQLRRETASLMDILLDIYRHSSTRATAVSLRYRILVLGVMQGIIQTKDGISALLDQDGWSILSRDLLSSLSSPSGPARSLIDQLVDVLGTMADNECIPEAWLDLATAMAALESAPKGPLQLAISLLENVPPRVRSRYAHTAEALHRLSAEETRAEDDD